MTDELSTECTKAIKSASNVRQWNTKPSIGSRKHLAMDHRTSNKSLTAATRTSRGLVPSCREQGSELSPCTIRSHCGSSSGIRSPKTRKETCSKVSSVRLHLFVFHYTLSAWGRRGPQVSAESGRRGREDRLRADLWELPLVQDILERASLRAEGEDGVVVTQRDDAGTL